VWKGGSSARHQSQVCRAGGERHRPVALDDNLGSYYGVGAVVPVATTLPGRLRRRDVGATVNVKAMLAYGGVALANKPV
jgi:hypothetical protein